MVAVRFGSEQGRVRSEKGAKVTHFKGQLGAEALVVGDGLVALSLGGRGDLLEESSRIEGLLDGDGGVQAGEHADGLELAGEGRLGEEENALATPEGDLDRDALGPDPVGSACHSLKR